MVAQLLLPKPTSGKPTDAASTAAADTETEPEYVSYGPQPFILRIRDQKTHQPLPGIVVGDIGPKYGYASMDNGYMLFDHFRVSKEAMLSRYAEVNDETGALNRRGHAAVVYGSLTFV